jgi:ABC-2 type transport system permease protein
MHNVWTIAKREYNQYFSSPVAYVVAFIIFLILGVFFYYTLLIANSAAAMQQSYVPGIDVILWWTGLLLAILTPALTTRLLAEERRLGTIELLMTAPVKDWELVVGKWLGAFLLLLTLIAVTLIYPLILDQLVSPGIDQGPLITGYLGLILVAAALVAIGVFISSLFSNQIAAFITSLGVVVFLWLVTGLLVRVTGQIGGVSTWLNYLDLAGPYTSNLLIGVLDLKDVIYYLSVTALALFMGTMSVEIRRWG